MKKPSQSVQVRLFIRVFQFELNHTSRALLKVVASVKSRERFTLQIIIILIIMAIVNVTVAFVIILEMNVTHINDYITRDYNPHHLHHFYTFIYFAFI